jgi:membrane protease YdiL (CAAX protease family)
VLTWVDHALFAVLAVLFPLWAAVFGMRRLRRAARDELPRARMWVYRRAITIQWALALVVAAHWMSQGRAWSELGLGLRFTPGLGGVLVGLLIVAIPIVRQRRQAMRDEEMLAQVRHQLSRLELLMPHTPRELSWFYRLSITAGICEELLYRGFMIWYLSHAMGLIPAIVVAGVLFGLAHAYQGTRGMLMTAGVGLFLGGVYLVAGSIYVGMLAHALMDIHSGHLGYVALTRLPEEAPVETSTESAEEAVDEDPAASTPEAGAASAASREI